MIKIGLRKVFLFGVVLISTYNMSMLDSITFADDSSHGNCGMITSAKDYSFITKERKNIVGNIFPEKAINTAGDHLRAYCCKKGYIVIEKDGKQEKDEVICTNTSEYYLESVLLYEHLIDIFLRRLDAYTRRGGLGDLVYNLEPDEKGKKWRTFIADLGENHLGVLPMIIDPVYKKTWSIPTSSDKSDQQLLRWNTDNQSLDYNPYKDFNITNSKDALTRINKDYANWNLGSRYRATCEISLMMYQILGGKQNMSVPSPSQENMKKYSKKDLYLNCKKLIKERIRQENEFVRELKVEKSRLFMEQYLNNFMITNFSKNRLDKLSELFRKMNGSIENVAKGVSKLVKHCT